MPDSDVTAKLHGTTDAQVWAREWCRIAHEIVQADDGRAVIDEGWMIGWFANAIEVGRTAGYQDGMARASAILGHPDDGH